VTNFTPVARSRYRVPLPHEGRWTEILNTDAAGYDGRGEGNMGGVVATGPEGHASAELHLPGLSTLWLRHEPA
jgi:1,4-alpha-glucan branching enzyme